jgi:hypothetical protein
MFLTKEQIWQGLSEEDKDAIIAGRYPEYGGLHDILRELVADSRRRAFEELVATERAN